MRVDLDRHEPGTHLYPFAESVDYVRAVGRGEAESTLRLYRPRKNMAFGRRDELREGFEDAAAAASRFGYEPLVRPVGGHAAGYHAGCLVVDHFQADADAVSGNTDRFEVFGHMFEKALETLGISAGVGEIPGEYCPGEHSVHAVFPHGSKTKIVGTAQRVVAGAWWFSTGIVVESGYQLREATEQVYKKLGLELEPETVGALTEINPILTVEDVEDAVLEAYAAEGWL
ncbi:lipoyl protein ligase domain-containing protein [Rothia aerolata]|uniref:BPL/LPL catalytic domain-containing protein n=1 Tax=Rothia aerolata TaxID=1812262 RepID=A0A917IMF9_9MICC|nr:lipoate--protein ligase family protein [Rothia aerolata]GGH57993.1 hypothetical protein GCM10007359_03700 [Rothia aerolata]